MAFVRVSTIAVINVFFFFVFRIRGVVFFAVRIWGVVLFFCIFLAFKGCKLLNKLKFYYKCLPGLLVQGNVVFPR